MDKKLEARIARLEKITSRKSIKNEDVNSQAELENHIGDLIDELRESYRLLINQYKSIGDVEMATLRRTELRALNELSNMRY